jgi:hypothetical protein
MPLVTASEDVGYFGGAAGVPTVFWFWGGLDTKTVLAAMAEGQLGSLPGNHSPLFAPVIEPTLTTGVQALTLAARTWLRASSSQPKGVQPEAAQHVGEQRAGTQHAGMRGTVPASRETPGSVPASAEAGKQRTP